MIRAAVRRHLHARAIEERVDSAAVAQLRLLWVFPEQQRWILPVQKHALVRYRPVSFTAKPSCAGQLGP